MQDIWSILELEPTKDISAIKRAYARLAGKYHPEEQPEQFLRLRQAYQAALDYAQGGGTSAPSPAAPAPEDQPPQQQAGWQLLEAEQTSAPNPYERHEAFLKFQELYTGKQQKNPKAWMDYFTSTPFLEVMHRRDFTALLRKTVEEQWPACPPSMELLRWLSIAYQYAQEEAEDHTGRRFRTAAGAGFDGLEDVFQIALYGPIPKRLQGNDLAMFLSFLEYNRLTALAESSGWSDQALGEAGKIFSFYTVSNLQDKCVMDKVRHPAGVKLLEQFFRRTDLPQELYRVLWDKLELKSALFGRAKILHGALRELVLQRVPDVEEAGVDLRRLNRERDAYSHRISQHPEREEEESAAFFAGGEFQKALRTRRFVQDQLLHYAFWLGVDSGPGFLRRLRDFYLENPDLPCAGQVVERVEQIVREKRVLQWNREDKSAPPPQGEPELTDRAFLRHWLNTGFYTAQHPDTRRPLLDYLKQNLPGQPEWSRRWLSSPEGKIEPKTFSIEVEGVAVEIVFRLRYVEYRLDGESVCQSCLPWRVLEGVQGRYFFYLLPLAAAFRAQLPQVRQALLERLEDTAAPAEDRAFLAGCLADQVCRLPEPAGEEDDPLDRLPLELFAENGEHLYGAVWYRREGVLILFEQTSAGRQTLPKGEYEHLYDEDAALSLARRLLEQAVSPQGYDLSLLKELPWKVYFLPPTGPEQKLVLDDVISDEDRAAGVPLLTQEDLEELLERFGRGELRRLELYWFNGELVLLRDRSGYACLFFEGGLQGGGWYAMLALPEVYRTVRYSETNFLPFGLGRLPDYCLFPGPAPILGNLNYVFPQIHGAIQTQAGDRELWARNLSLSGVHNGFLNMIKQKVGLFPPERSRNYTLTKFLLSRFPVLVRWVNLQGMRTRRQLDKGGYSQGNLGLVEFMQKKLAWLCLTWEIPLPDQSLARRHLVLRQDDGRFMLAWLQDDKQTAEFLVSDIRTYLDVEGKRYPKDTFLGKAVPAYLVHSDLKDIRNMIDLLLDDIDRTEPVTGQFARFAQERPDKPRPYEAIRQELVGEEEQ